VRPWIDHLGFSIVKAVGAKKTPRLFYFKKESSNAFNAIYIKYPLCHHAYPSMSMDNEQAP